MEALRLELREGIRSGRGETMLVNSVLLKNGDDLPTV